MIYVILYSVMLIFGLISRKDASQRNLAYYICLVALFFFVGFRYHVGCDWNGYLTIFQFARYNEDAMKTTEATFWALNRLLHYYDLDYPYINVISSFFFFLGLNELARRQPDRLGILILAFPVLIMNLAMSGIRQGIALGWLCFAFNAFIDASIIRFVAFVGIASLFHTSAQSFLILAPFVRGTLTRKSVALAGLLALPALYFLMSTATFDMYSQRYISSSTEAAGAPFRAGLIALTGWVFYWFYNSKWKTLFPRDYKVIHITSYLMMALFPLAFLSSVGADRFGYYLTPAQLVILTRLPYLARGPYADYIYVAPYLIGGATLLVWASFSSLFQLCYLPYQFWW